jgi:hypothetical protein
MIENIENVQVQFHNISANANQKMERIKSKLKNTHKPTYMYEFVWENWVRKSNCG